MKKTSQTVGSRALAPGRCFRLGAGLKTPEITRAALWSAATGRRFFRLADWPAKQRRAERREEASEPTARHRIARPTTFDGDESPAKSGENSPHCYE
jgi:hypothetical protein